MLGSSLVRLLIIPLGFFSALLHATGTINIQLGEDRIYRTPENFIRASLVMDEMITSLGGYDEYIDKDNVIPLANVMYGSETLHLNKLFEIFAVQIDNKDRNNEGINLQNWEITFQNIAQNATSQDLLELFIAAKYLDIPFIVKECATLWAAKYFTNRSEFDLLDADAKKIIITKLSRENFIELALKSNEPFEESYQIALLAHMGFVAPKGFSARELYHQVYYRYPRITTCGYSRM